MGDRMEDVSTATRVEVTDACIGSGVCEAIDPAMFAVTDDGLAEVLKAAHTPQELADARAAADQCPALAIILHK